jgi:hypothetical protein
MVHIRLPARYGAGQQCDKRRKEQEMRVKLFWKNQPGQPSAGLFKGLSFREAENLEREINAWLQQNPRVKIVDIKQSASGGSYAGSLWLISLWYEEAAETAVAVDPPADIY